MDLVKRCLISRTNIPYVCAFLSYGVWFISIPVRIGERFIVDPMPRTISTNFTQSNPSIRIVGCLIWWIYCIYIVPFVKIWKIVCGCGMMPHWCLAPCTYTLRECIVSKLSLNLTFLIALFSSSLLMVTREPVLTKCVPLLYSSDSQAAFWTGILSLNLSNNNFSCTKIFVFRNYRVLVR